MAKFDKQLFHPKYFFGITLLHAHTQYIYIVYAKYQKASVKAQCMHYLSTSKREHMATKG